MQAQLGDIVLRPLEPRDLPALQRQKNDPRVGDLLGGFTTGYAAKDLDGWLEFHRTRSDEALFAIASATEDACLGHVGLYRLDHRARTGEFAIMLGEVDWWGRGVGRKATAWMIDYGFEMLNLNRIELTVLESNPRAQGLYEKLGFVVEGVRRQAQYKQGRYLDVTVMGLLRSEWLEGRGS